MLGRRFEVLTEDVIVGGRSASKLNFRSRTTPLVLRVRPSATNFLSLACRGVLYVAHRRYASHQS